MTYHIDIIAHNLVNKFFTESDGENKVETPIIYKYDCEIAIVDLEKNKIEIPIKVILKDKEILKIEFGYLMKPPSKITWEEQWQVHEILLNNHINENMLLADIKSAVKFH